MEELIKALFGGLVKAIFGVDLFSEEDKNKDVHGNYTKKDVHGNRTDRDVHGNPTNRDAHGNPM